MNKLEVLYSTYTVMLEVALNFLKTETHRSGKTSTNNEGIDQKSKYKYHNYNISEHSKHKTLHDPVA